MNGDEMGIHFFWGNWGQWGNWGHSGGNGLRSHILADRVMPAHKWVGPPQELLRENGGSRKREYADRRFAGDGPTIHLVAEKA